MSKQIDIQQLAERIASKGNLNASAHILRMAQAVGDMPSDNFDEAGSVPPIESYVKHNQPSHPVQTHTATVAFAAPHGVSEADIMEYILGIADALGVKVESFKWSVQESKKQTN